MSVRNLFMIEIYGFRHSLHTFRNMPLIMPLQQSTLKIEVIGRLENECKDIVDS